VSRNRLPWAIPIAVVLLGVILFTQGAGDTLLTTLRQLRTAPDDLNSVYSSFTQDEPVVETGAAIAPDTDAQLSAAAIEDTPTPAPEEPTAPPAPTSEPTQVPSPTPAEAESDSPDVAATIVAAARAQAFDLTTFLNEQTRPDLAALGIHASWAPGAPPGELILQGTVTLTSDQIELLELATEIEGVTSINHDALVVDLPETYLVREGENLRHIAYRLYGDSARWREIYDANQDLIGEEPNNLWVGLSLTVPQEEEPQEEQSQP
jgi:nucleoid-associated protein YgaU